MERYASMLAGTMPPALALGTFLDFARTALLQKELWVLPDELAGQLRLLGQRCTRVTPGVGAGSMNAAQESILREHLLKLVWQFPKLEKLLAGVLSSQEAHAFGERLYAALPADRRSSDSKALQRLQAANGGLDRHKVDAEVARTPSVEDRIASLETFAREVRDGFTAAQSSGGDAGGDESAGFLRSSIGGSQAAAGSVQAALGLFASLRAKIKSALDAGDVKLAWGLVALGRQLLPQQVMFNVAHRSGTDATLIALLAQRGSLPVYFGDTVAGLLRLEQPDLFNVAQPSRLAGFSYDKKQLDLLMRLQLHQLNIFDYAVQQPLDVQTNETFAVSVHWVLYLVQESCVRSMGRAGDEFLAAAGWLKADASQPVGTLCYSQFMDELAKGLRVGDTIRHSESRRLAHLEQIVECYLGTMEYAGIQAKAVLTSNPEDKALGYLIPSVQECAPLVKMRSLHQNAAGNRGRANAEAPASPAAAKGVLEPAASLLERLSFLYGKPSRGAGGPGPPAKRSGEGLEDSWSDGKWPVAKWPKLSEFGDVSLIGSMPDFTWYSGDGQIIYVGTGLDAYWVATLREHLGFNKCLPTMVCRAHGAKACTDVHAHGQFWTNSWHAKPVQRLVDALKAAKAPPFKSGGVTASPDGAAALAEGEPSAEGGGEPTAEGEAAPAGGRGGGKGKGGGKGG